MAHGPASGGARRPPRSAVHRRGAGLAVGAAVLGGVAGLSLPLPAGIAFLGGTGSAAVAVAGLASYRRLRALAARAQLFRQVFDAATAGRAILDPAGHVADANAALRRLAGTTASDPLAGVRARLAVSEAGAEGFDRLLESARAGTATTAELPVRGDDGGQGWWQIEAEPLGNWPGYVLVRIADITASRQNAEAARREQARLHDFLDHAPVGFFSLDSAGAFALVNATLANWLETTPEKLTETPVHLHEVIPPPAAPARPFDLVSRGGPDQRGEVTLIGRFGRRIQAFIAQRVVQDEWGNLRTRAVVRDLTPEREWAAALRSSEARFQRLFDTAPIGIALMRADLRILECNPAFAELLGGASASVAGMAQLPLAEQVSDADRAALVDRLGDVCAGHSWDGPPLEVRPAASPDKVVAVMARREDSVLDLGAATAGLIVYVLDMTEQRELERRFAQAQRMEAVGQLAGGIAHDFNNLLTALTGYADLLISRHSPGTSGHAEAQRIRATCDRGSTLVRQLLAYARQQELQPQLLDPGRVLAEMTYLLRRVIGDNVTLDVADTAGLWAIKADPGQLEQVIVNLCVNARDAIAQTDAGTGRITVTAHNRELSAPLAVQPERVPAGAYVAVSVTDTGVGIAPADQQRIFEPFFSTKGQAQGSGLGLATVYGIVRQTGGYIALDSRPGAGTRVTLFFPRHSVAPPGASDTPAGEQQPLAATAPLAEAPGTVLLVEDEEAVRTFAATALERAGYRVLAASDGDSALAELAAHGGPVALLITDIVMPGMDGATLMRRIRRDHPDIAVIFISGYAGDQIDRQAPDLADAVFLNKPFSLNRLVNAAQTALNAGTPAA